MAISAARNVLICFVPAVIVLFSLYWFKKKRKIKPDGSSCLSTGENGSILNSQDGVSDSSVECSSDFADTLSDASSFTSPENCIRTMCRPEDEHAKKTVTVSNHFHQTSSLLVKTENLCLDSSDIKIPNEHKCNFDDPNCMGDIEFIEPKFENAVLQDLNSSNIYQFQTPEKVTFVEERTENSVSIKSGDEHCRKAEVQEMNCNGNDYEEISDSFEYDIEIQSEPLISRMQSKDFSSNETDVYKQTCQVQTAETESNSSVLDENSFSGASDESELQRVKNKDSPSSMLDENSILSSMCDDLEKTDISEDDVITMQHKTDAKNTTNDNSNAVENENTAMILIGKIEIKQSKDPSVAETIDCENVSNQNFSSKLSFTAPQFQNVDINNCDSMQDSHVVTNHSETLAEQIKDNEVVVPSANQQLPIIDSDVQTSDTTKPVLLSDNFCDNQKSYANSSPLSIENLDSDENMPLPSSELISDISTNVCDGLSPTDKPKTSLAGESETVVNSSSCVKDPQISSMDTEEQFMHSYVAPSVPSRIPFSDPSWKVQDSKLEPVLSRSKVGDSEELNIKFPGITSAPYVYEFDLPQEFCGRLIGRQGRHVKSIKERTNANVLIKRHPYDPLMKTVVVEGNRSDVTEALEIIRRKYPPSQFPTVTLVQTNLVNSHVMSLPDSLQLHLPEGASCDVILSSLVSAGHFFLQQPTHPTYPSLSTLDQCMINCYSQANTPLLPHPVEAGVICAAPVMRGWYRALVRTVYENGTDCEIKFVDYGGFLQVATSTLRQIRSDYMTLPFQASECYLANVRPIDCAAGWSAEATATFEELAQGQILQALLVEYADDGIPCVHLYRVQGITNMFINRELVDRGLAVWVENHWDPH